jgi:CheY-like chemotaxis protein/phosphoribosyl 1,2-cyclic phosphodiesterase
MSLRVLVVDDDDIAGGLSRDLLKEKGLEADLLTDSLKAVDAIKKNGYPLVVLDILMPGMDGLTLCHKIKSDPQIKATKVVMVSGKSFEADRTRARELGADLFIEKPYDVETFAQRIAEVAGRKLEAAPPPQAVPTTERLANTSPIGELTVWGCRALPGVGGANGARYGTKTSCVSLKIGTTTIVFDAGSGAVDLGQNLTARPGAKELWLLMTHFHKDHILGLGDFAPARSAKFTIHVCGAPEPGRTLQQTLEKAFEDTMTQSGAVECAFELHPMAEQVYELEPGTTITTFYGNHPGMTLGYVLETKGRKLVYCPDSEVYGESATALQDYDEKLARIAKDADLMILDGRYTEEDYRALKNHGHSSFASAVDVAAKAGAKRLMLFHMDAQYDDAMLDRVSAAAQKRVHDKEYRLQVALARDGVTIGF